MSEQRQNSPSKKPDDPRQDRLKAALKANLQKRKAQARSRKTKTDNTGA